MMPCPPRMRGCKADCLHRRAVTDYRAERQRQEHAAEVASVGYKTELAEHLAAHPLVTFKAWLVGTAGRKHAERAA